MTLDTILAFLFGCLFGFLLAAYILHRPELDVKPKTSFDPEQMNQLMQQQISFIQMQNMLKGLQLQAAKQEQDLRQIERSRQSHIVLSERTGMTYVD